MDVGATAVFWTECQWSMEVGTGSLGLVGRPPGLRMKETQRLAGRELAGKMWEGHSGGADTGLQVLGMFRSSWVCDPETGKDSDHNPSSPSL